MRILADIILIIHAAYALFVVAGQLLIIAGCVRHWRWVRNILFRSVHLVALGLVIIEVWLGLSCPLTELENSLRAGAGEGGYAVSFITYWLERMLFYSAPPWVFTLTYTAFGLLVATTWIACPPRRK